MGNSLLFYPKVEMRLWKSRIRPYIETKWEKRSSGAAIAHLYLPSCRKWFESLGYHLPFYHLQSNLYYFCLCIVNRTKIKTKKILGLAHCKNEEVVMQFNERLLFSSLLNVTKHG